MEVWHEHLRVPTISIVVQIDLEFAGSKSWCICDNGTCLFPVFVWKFLWFSRFFPFLSSIGEVYWLIPPDPLRRGILITNAPGRRREVPDRNRYPILGWDASEELGMVILGQDWNGDWENGKTHFWILDIIQETSFLHLQTSCCPKGNWSEESKFRIVSGPGINHFDWMRSLRTFGIHTEGETCLNFLLGLEEEGTSLVFSLDTLTFLDVFGRRFQASPSFRIPWPHRNRLGECQKQSEAVLATHQRALGGIFRPVAQKAHHVTFYDLDCWTRGSQSIRMHKRFFFYE